MVRAAAADYGRADSRAGTAGTGEEQGDRRGMSGFWGADTDALRTMSTILARRARVLGELEGTLASAVDSLEWVGEDAEHFRAEWTRGVRTGLQDQEFELRLRARRLAQHADEQDAVSAPDGGGLGGGRGGWSTPGQLLRDLPHGADSVLRDLLGGAPGQQPGQHGPLAELLREVLASPQGRSAFLGAFLGSALGGLLADVVLRAIRSGAAPQALLEGLGPGAGLSDLLGAAPRGADGPSAPDGDPSGGDAAQGAGGADPGSGGAAGSAGAGSSADGSGADGSGSTGEGAGTGGEAGGAGAADVTVGADAGADASAGAADARGARRSETVAEGPALSGGTTDAARFAPTADEDPLTLLDRLREMVGDVIGPATGGAASAGDDIGTAGLDGARR